MKKIVSVLFTLIIAVSAFAEQVKFDAFTGPKSPGASEYTYYAGENNEVGMKLTSPYVKSSKYGILYGSGKLNFKSYNQTVTLTFTVPEGKMINSITFGLSTEIINNNSTYTASNGTKTFTTGLTYDSNKQIMTNLNKANKIYIETSFSATATFGEISVVYSDINQENNVVLSDAEDYEYEGDIFCTSVTYTRNLSSSRYGTLCLPFPFKVSSAFSVYLPSGYSYEDGLTLEKVSNGTLIPASTAVVYRVGEGVEQLVVKSKNVMMTDEGYDYDEDDDLTCLTERTSEDGRWTFNMIGTLNRKILTSGFYIAADNIWEVEDGEEIGLKRYRGYFTITENYPETDEKPTNKAKLRLVDGDNVEEINMTKNAATGIEETVSSNDETSGIYNVAGIKMNNMAKGLNIVKTANGFIKVMK